MNEQMTLQEAIKVLANVDMIFGGNPFYVDRAAEAQSIALSAVRAYIPHVLTLAEAGSLEPHTAVWVEFRIHGTMDGPYAVGSILRKGDWSCYMHTVRWWNLWPSEELRDATPWEEKQNA